MSQPTPLREDLYRIDASGPVLTGGRCASCGFVGFPRAAVCLECGNTTIEREDIGGKGELFVETTVHMSNGRFPPGYSVGYVRFPSGIRVFGQIRKAGEQPLPIGSPMRVEIVTLYEDNGQPVEAFRFHPQ